jgi:metal-responsive CopG/Arc/MetJ family transcriptional regulator
MTTRLAISMDDELVREVDSLVKREAFPNRSAAIQLAVREKFGRRGRSRLARECAKLDPKFEQAVSEGIFAIEKRR